MESFEFLLLALPLGVVGVVGGRILVRGFLGFVGVGFRRARHVERSEQAMHRFCKGALVEHRAIEPVEFGAGLAFDIGAPEVDNSMRAARRLQSRQPLAHEHRHRVFERRLVAVAGLGEGALVIPVVEHRGQIRGDAFHPPRPDRLDPRLLDRVEQRARRLVLRGMAAMDRVVVAGEPQRHRNRRARAGSRSRADWACAAAPAGAPWRRPGRRPARACRRRTEFPARGAGTSRACTRRAPA